MGRRNGGNGNGRIHVIEGDRGEFPTMARQRIPRLPGGHGILGYALATLLAILLIGIFNLPTLAANVHVNIWWFESVRLGDVYGRMWNTQRNLFLAFFFISYLFLTAIFFATRFLTFRPGPDQVARWTGAALSLATGFIVTCAAIISGHVMASQWQQYLLSSHGQSFGVTDPIHRRDVGFYIFQLPWRQTLSGFAIAVLILGALELAALAFAFTTTSPYQTARGDVRRMISIGSLFGAVLFGFLAWRNFYLNPFFLNQSGRVYGGGATFVHASLWWYPIVGAVEVITAIVLLVNTFLRRFSLAWIALLPIVVGLSSTVGQGIFQKFVVSPNELSAEFKYLGWTVSNTRHAYGIDTWAVRRYTPHALTQADLASNPSTVADARIADSGAFTQYMRQRQENRTYYSFNTANIDRYVLNRSQRQVLLAARELDYSKLSLQTQSWVNQRVQFTHGYGLTMAPANTVTPDGQPVLWIQNVPVQETTSGLPPVREPRIYFGQNTGTWVLVHATAPEFDSSTADTDISYRYQGPDGVLVGSGLRRLTLAWIEEGGFPFFDKLNISGYIGANTRILLHRDIVDRVQTIAPWLTIDSNPYLVLRQNGSLVWMLDGITTTDAYPYSDPTNGVNYARNSVKIVLDAYTGRATFYAFDSSDPILRAWSSVFPGLMHPLSQMPADLRSHIKYADDFLNWQATAYNRYHVTDITSYYNGDNEWDVENATTYDWNAQQTITGRVDPIWTVARLFGQPHDSFFSVLPFSVRGKATMAGYLAADNNTYHVTALDMPRGAQTMGIAQFESLYNQAPTISSTLTLIDQHGSQVVPGQMLILPVGKALLYIKPLYLRSASSQTLPQLIRVVVGTQNAVNWGFTLKEALNNLLTQGDISNLTPSQTGNPSASPNPQPTTVPPVSAGRYARMSDAQLIALAQQDYNLAQRTPSLSQKDRDLRQVGIILGVLRSRHR